MVLKETLKKKRLFTRTDIDSTKGNGFKLGVERFRLFVRRKFRG